jgi:hypothetical protein
MDSWTDDLSARERIRRVAETLSQPRSVNWIRQEAEVSWATAKDELDRLVEHEQLRRVYPNTEGESAEDPRYVPDYKTQYLSRIRELTDDHSRAELREEIATIQDEIGAWREEFDVAGRDELEASLTDEGLTGDEVRRRNRVLRQWNRNEETKTLLRHALDLYDDLADLETESSATSPA